MKIALFTDGIYPYVIGGMQKHSFYLAKYFALNKIHVDLYHTAANLSGLQRPDCFTEEEHQFITSIPIAYPPKGKFPGHYISEMHAYSASLTAALNKREPVDFIYVQGLCGTYLLQHKEKIKAPIGINFHGLEMFQQPADFRSRLEQYLFKRPVTKAMQQADVVFSLGGKLTEIIKKRGIAAEKIVQIAIGIDSSWINMAPLKVNTVRKFVFIGRYERRKGIEELTNTIQLLLPEQTFSFDFIGAIPEDKKIKAANIQYHGSITDVKKIRELLTAADVLVCPSYSEGMPTVILEAMASGLAIIASNVGAVAEEVNADNGMLVPAGDVAALKEAIITFINKPEEELIRMKKNSIQKVSRDFLWEGIIDKTIAAIQLRRRQAPPGDI